MGIKVKLKPNSIEVIDNGGFESLAIKAYIHSFLKNIKAEDVKEWMHKEVDRIIRRARIEEEKEEIKKIEKDTKFISEVKPKKINIQVKVYDYSNYDPQLCRNGGKYVFWTTYVLKNGKWERYYETSAEFEFCPYSGKFTSCVNCPQYDRETRTCHETPVLVDSDKVEEEIKEALKNKDMEVGIIINDREFLLQKEV